MGLLRNIFCGKKKVVAVIPRGRIVKQFVPKENFYSNKMQSQYIANMTYHLREGNAVLEAQMAKWESEGLITIL